MGPNGSGKYFGFGTAGRADYEVTEGSVEFRAGTCWNSRRKKELL
jgi:Fe-S cluster assembly ATPase SufC